MNKDIRTAFRKYLIRTVIVMIMVFCAPGACYADTFDADTTEDRVESILSEMSTK